MLVHLTEEDWERIRPLTRRLGCAFDVDIKNGSHILRAKRAINRAGYKVELIVELTMAMYKEETNDNLERNQNPKELELNLQDHKFLKAIKVRVDEKKK